MAKRFAFTAVQRRGLQQEGLTEDQLDRLRRALPNVADSLRPSAHIKDVRACLQRIAEPLEQAPKAFIACESGRFGPAGRETIGHLNMAKVAGLADPGDGTIPDRAVFGELLKLISALRASAMQSARSQKRPGHPGASRAVEYIVEALLSPTDDASRAAAKKLQVSRSEPRGRPSFVRVVGIAFEAAWATLADEERQGVSSVPGVDRAIRAFQAKVKGRTVMQAGA